VRGKNSQVRRYGLVVNSFATIEPDGTIIPWDCVASARVTTPLKRLRAACRDLVRDGVARNQGLVEDFTGAVRPEGIDVVDGYDDLTLVYFGYRDSYAYVYRNPEKPGSEDVRTRANNVISSLSDAVKARDPQALIV
jgi:hypothetical protein